MINHIIRAVVSSSSTNQIKLQVNQGAIDTADHGTPSIDHDSFLSQREATTTENEATLDQVICHLKLFTSIFNFCTV